MGFVNSNTYREIFHQPEMWRQTYSIISERKEEISNFLSNYYNNDVTVVFTGAGTSSYVGNILQYLMVGYGITNYKSVATTDLTTHADTIFLKNKKYILVSLARSGNSPESIAAVDIADSICGDNISHIFITCNAEGALAKREPKSNVLSLILPDATNDKGLAMTSSFSSMLLMAMLVFDLNNVEENRAGVDKLSKKAEYMLNRYSEDIQKIAAIDFERAVFLGSGEKKGIAEECHLKLQELTDGKVICLFDSFLGFRHGPKAALNEKTLIIYLFADDEKTLKYEIDLVVQINQQIKPAGQIYVAERKIEQTEVKFDLEMVPETYENTKFDVILYVLVGQLLGLFKNVELKLDPDSPSASGKIARVVEGVTIY
ncbi:MAG: SIS domain-containing protein [Bacteroidota bacterium]|nr:SIS domain-containing protein [Bacteroidota bacterium]